MIFCPLFFLLLTLTFSSSKPLPFSYLHYHKIKSLVLVYYYYYYNDVKLLVTLTNDHYYVASECGLRQATHEQQRDTRWRLRHTRWRAEPISGILRHLRRRVDSHSAASRRDGKFLPRMGRIQERLWCRRKEQGLLVGIGENLPAVESAEVTLKRKHIDAIQHSLIYIVINNKPKWLTCTR